VARQHPRHANVFVLRWSYRDALTAAAEGFNDAVAELDRLLSGVGDRVDETVHATRAAIRAGKLAFEQERRRERVRGPVGLVAGYKPSNSG
jgi:hypothetical protein